MLRDMVGVAREVFTPGTVVAFDSSSIKCVAVIFERNAWAELAVREFGENQIEAYMKCDFLIPLRILGGALGLSEIAEDVEPNERVIRNYCCCINASGVTIIDDLTALIQAYIHFDRIHDVKAEDVALDLQMVQKYLKGEHNGRYIARDNSYGRKMFTLLSKGIPL